eukprot:15476066-Alexandrium_andersonii.AAC.1
MAVRPAPQQTAQRHLSTVRGLGIALAVQICDRPALAGKGHVIALCGSALSTRTWRPLVSAQLRAACTRPRRGGVQ